MGIESIQPILTIAFLGKYPYQKVPGRKYSGYKRDLKTLKSQSCFQMLHADWKKSENKIDFVMLKKSMIFTFALNKWIMTWLIFLQILSVNHFLLPIKFNILEMGVISFDTECIKPVNYYTLSHNNSLKIIYFHISDLSI